MNNIDNKIEKAIQILNANGVVGIPTETVYGLAAAIDSEEGINCIFSTKERPFFDPLIVHISSVEQAKSCTGQWNETCDLLVQSFWPGPLTLILPKNETISEKITSGLKTVGLRMPDHQLCLDLIKKLGRPVAAPSANKFKKTSPTSAIHVQNSFQDLYVLDGGICEVGIESTILGFNENGDPVIYRPGMITKAEIEKCLNTEVSIQESPVAPGHLKHHYMPETPIIASIRHTDLTKHKEIETNLLVAPLKWSLPIDPTECARVLYSKFRELDQKSASSIIIEFSKNQIEDPHYEAIFNRLFKAARYKII